MKFFYLMTLFFLTTSIFFACSPSSISEYRNEGEGRTRDLIAELENIYSREELVKASPRLKRLFEELVDLIVEAKIDQKERPELFYEDFAKKENRFNDKLRNELNRIYRIDGGRELVEKAQKNALHKLDSFESRSST